MDWDAILILSNSHIWQRKECSDLKMMSFPHKRLAQVRRTTVWQSLSKGAQMPIRDRTKWPTRVLPVMNFHQLWGLQNWSGTYYPLPFIQIEGKKNTQTNCILLASNLGKLEHWFLHPMSLTSLLPCKTIPLQSQNILGKQQGVVCYCSFPFLVSKSSWKSPHVCAVWKGSRHNSKGWDPVTLHSLC